MTFKANLSVKEGLDHLAKRLDPIIAAKLAPNLGGHPWTVVLDILDEKKGFSSSYKHWTYDLQAQLRMITERLGDFGYPFDDKQRTVSTLGNELRIVRKQMAHMHGFTVDEAFRANDFCVRLLAHFGDEAGLGEARRIRHEALVELAVAEGVTETVAAQSTLSPGCIKVEEPTSGPVTDTKPAAGSEVISPGSEVFEREPSVIGARRLEFEPWTVVKVGTVDVLDDLPKKAAKEKVRAVALEIATYEGPIHLDRLVEKTAQSFGLQRVRASRERKIAYQIHQTGLFVDADKFVWPHEINRENWSEFRPNDSNADRPFIHISPIEIANAARFIETKKPGVTEEEFDLAILQTFGRKRRTKQVVAHLSRSKELL